MKRLFAAESILFQNTGFFDELVLTYEELKTMPQAEVPDSEQIHRISKIIKKHTGLEVIIDTASGHNFCIELPQVDRNNPLINNAYRQFNSSADGLAMINKADGVIHGTVDIGKARVSGVFAELSGRMHIDFSSRDLKKLSPQELAAVTLHEVGHLFTYFEFFSRSVFTNQVIAGLSKILDGVENQDKREIALTTAKKKLQLDKLDLSKIKGLSGKTVEVVFIDAVVQQTRTELGYNLFAESSWEYLADQFVARHGAGVHLASALDKVYRSYGNIAYRSLGVYILVEALKLTMLYTGIGLGIAFIMISMDSQDGGGYDLPAARLKRIRDQGTEYVKDKTISNKEKARVIEDIRVIDKLLSEMTNRKQLVTFIHEFVSKRTRDERNYRQLQYDLEKLALNDLYVKAAEFELLK